VCSSDLTYHYAIGQGDMLATPLQVNLMTSVVASDGLLCAPKILLSEGVGRPECRKTGVGQKTLQVIRQGMIEACASGGTAYPFFDYKPQVVCKTGTAEISVDGKTHAWFTAYSPSGASAAEGAPQIVVTVLVEGGGEGSKVAAPIAKKIFESWFGQDSIL
jgi:cell division protein FtsI/penicillin-binding protein 2